MKSVLDYREQRQIIASDCQMPSICDAEIETLPSDVKDKVIDYMFSDDFRGWHMVGGYSDTDAFTGRSMHTYSTQLNDGEYVWFDNLALYVKNYDVKLPECFVEHVMEFYENGGKVHPYFDWRAEG